MQHEHFATIDSTNLETLRRWRLGEAREPLLITAETQTNGIGRNGRSWQSPIGGIWLTLLAPLSNPAGSYAGLPIAVGVAVATLLDQQCGISCRIKWPNDLLVDGRKIAGVLCQMELSPPPGAVAIGVGINGNFRTAELGPDLLQTSITLRDATGTDVDLQRLGSDLADRLLATLDSFTRAGQATSLDEAQRRLAWRGEMIQVTLPGDTAGPRGRILRLDANGALVLQVEDTVQTLSAGEVSRIRLA